MSIGEIINVVSIVEKVSKLSIIVSAIIFPLISITIYALNRPYSYIEKPLGISKYSKKNVAPFIILVFCVMILGSLIFICINTPINNSKNMNVGLPKNFYKLIIFYVIYIILTIISFKSSTFFKNNKLDLFNGSIDATNYKIFKFFIKHRNFDLVILMVLITGITFFAFLLGYNIEGIFLKILIGIIFLGNIILSIDIYSYFETANNLMNLNLRKLKLKNNTTLYCKIIYQNNKYTCVYQSRKIVYIDSSEILSIEEYPF